MQRDNLRTILFSLIIMIMSAGMIFAQGGGGNHGGNNGGNHGGNHGGDHDGPGGGNWGQDDSTGHGDHDGNWGHGDSTGHDSSGFGGHHGGGHWGPGDGAGHGFHDGGWGHHDSLSLDTVMVSGVISTTFDTLVFHGGHHFPGAPDSGEVVRISYFMDINSDDSADYLLRGLHRLSHTDSTFTLPVDGNEVEITGLLVALEERIDGILVLNLSITDDADRLGTLSIADPGQLTKSHALQSVSYPNPFNPSTTIEFTLENAGLVSLRVYDIRGVEVAVLADSHFGAGIHKLGFNPQGLSAGTYLYVLESNAVREVKRIAYLK